MLHPTKIRTLSRPLCFQTTMAIHATIYINIRWGNVPDSSPEKWRVTLQRCTKLNSVCFLSWKFKIKQEREWHAILHKIKCYSYGNILISQQIIHHSCFSHHTENGTWSDWFYCHTAVHAQDTEKTNFIT